MKNIFLILILVLAIFLRIFKLGDIPKTLYGDEQAFAWNAYSILLTGKDEYGEPYPLQFKSFNDYKSPIPVYLLVPFIKIFDLTIFGIRLPIAIASVLTVGITYFLAKLFLNTRQSLLTAFLLAVSPWHVHLSRGFFESTLSLLFYILGIYYFVAKKKRLNLYLSMFFFGLSMYSYFTPRILVPIFLIFLFAYEFFREGKNSLKKLIMPSIFLLILMTPLIINTVFSKGFSRFVKLNESMNLIISETVNRERRGSALPEIARALIHNKLTVNLRLIKNNYLEHLSANFWYIYGDNSLRYFTGNTGMFFLFEMPLFIIGLFYLIKEKKTAGIFFLAWILLSPIPASIVGRPFAVRSLAMLPAPFIFVSYGLFKIGYLIKEREVLKSVFPHFMFFVIVLALGSNLVRYYFEYPVFAATWWGWENKAAIDYANKRESQYDYIFLSDFYTGMPLAFAVYTKADPNEYRIAVSNPVVLADGRHLIKFGKYYIGSLDIDEKRKNQGIIPVDSLYIGRPEEADSPETINAPDDGRIIYKIYKTP